MINPVEIKSTGFIYYYSKLSMAYWASSGVYLSASDISWSYISLEDIIATSWYNLAFFNAFSFQSTSKLSTAYWAASAGKLPPYSDVNWSYRATLDRCATSL